MITNPLRSLARFLTTPHVRTGLALGTAAAIESNQPSLIERPRTDQAIVVAGSFASGYLVGSGPMRIVERMPGTSPPVTDALAGIASAFFPTIAGPKINPSRNGSLVVTAARVAAAGAAGVGSLLYLRNRIGRYKSDGREPPSRADTAWTLSVGIGGSFAAGGIIMAERIAARTSASFLNRTIGGSTSAWLPLIHVMLGGSLRLAGRAGVRSGLAKVSASNRRTEIRYSEPPTTDTVSGGVDSAVAFEDLGLQGRRFVAEASSGAQIDEVLDESGSLDAVRVYVGVESADTVEDRVSLAIAELHRTGAFDRSVLIVGSPAGTGYFNSIPVEAAEYLARGDVASVAIQYGSLPSLLSASKVPLAIAQHSALLRAINETLQKREPDDRPRIVLYGESLGAVASQGTFTGGGTDVLDDLGIDRALWVGTPYSGKWRQEMFGGGPSIDDSLFGRFATIDEYRELPEDDHETIRFFFLDHHEDPVTRFSFDLAYRRPAWLGPVDQRPPNVSRTQRWVPIVTFWQTAIDTKNAATVIPGAFEAFGHDYRADLARFVSTAYDLPDVTGGQMASIEERLRRSEVERAAKIADG